MRKAHWLKANKGVELPVHCVFFDTETRSTEVSHDKEEAKLWFGWACYVRRYRDQTWGKPAWSRFTTPLGFWRWLDQRIQPKRKLYIFSHNTGFDFTIVKGFKYLRSRGWENTGRILDDPPTVIRFRKDGCTLCFIDTLNYFRLPLKEVGKFVGLEKYEQPEQEQTKAEWDTYCRRDVEIITAAMQTYWRMVHRWQLGNFAYTLPAQAFKAYRHRFMDTPIFIDDNEKANVLSRRAYVGARTECFRIGKIEERVTCLDINSQYPFIMATTRVPTRLVTTLSQATLSELSEYCTDYCVVADVMLNTTLNLFPKKIPGWTIFPIGTFRTVLNTPEIQIALKMGAIERVFSVVVYEGSVIFKEYVNFFYEQRMEAKANGDEALATMLKLMMNSLYGKFGQNGRKYEHRWRTPDDNIKTWLEWDADKKTLHRYRQFAGVVEELQRDAESSESFPAIAGHITSAARLLLADFIAQAKPENTLYVDTDSLFVNDRGYRNLAGRISEERIGWLKKEWESEEMVIHGAKDYQVGGKLKRKGIRANAEILDESTFRQVQFRGFKGMIQDGDLDCMLIRQVTKHLTRVYSKGVVDPQGIVHPLVFPHPDYPDL